MFEKFYQNISALFPRKAIRAVGVLMMQGGFAELSPRLYVGFATFFSVCIALIALFLTPFFTANRIVQVVAPVAVLFITGALSYVFLLMTADARARKIEQILPDALQIISANIRAGMTLENAIWSAARPEFGPLRDEITRVSADTFGGTPVQETLMAMTKRVRSTILERAMKLVVEGIRLGGEMSNLLTEVAEDIRTNYLLKKEIATSTMMYSIFIVFAGVVAAPLLFSVSVYYSEMNEAVLQRQAAQITGQMPDQAAGGQVGLSGVPGMGAGPRGETAIKSQDVYWFAIGSITITTFFAALILSMIRHGKALRGLKHAPIFMLVALSLFYVAHSFLKAAFSTLLG